MERAKGVVIFACIIELINCAPTAPLTDTFAMPTSATTETSRLGEGDEETIVGVVATTEEVMDPRIRMSELAEAQEGWEASWDANRVVRDVAYLIRGHKFTDYDRRYYGSPEEATERLYEAFPRPPLRSLHWEVRRHCQASFLECLRYLDRMVALTALRREDDTVTVVKERNWDVGRDAERILAVERECRMARRRDDLIAAPFRGPIERFQWRTTVSYYMCWYAMLGVPELGIFGESCDNHANCLDDYGIHNVDPRADDAKPYACALYSFCPDHCCPMKHISYAKDCFQSRLNPCYAGNAPDRRRCTLNREENRDFLALLSNRINVSCECRAEGYEWSSRFGLCVDVNECTRGDHNCSVKAGETCINLPGGFECACKLGYVYDARGKACVRGAILESALAEVRGKPNGTKTRSLLALIVEGIAGSIGDRPRVRFSLLVLTSSAAVRLRTICASCDT